MTNYKKDILYNGLPAVWNGKQFLVFSSYIGEIAVLSPVEIKSKKIENQLKKEDFFGKPYALHKNPKAICLVLTLTTNCRLGCRYCYRGEIGKKEEMTLKTALSAIKAAYKEKSKTADSIEIHFFGGEPTLEFPLIKKVVSFVKKLPLKNKYFRLTTDGLFSKKELDWLIKENFFLTISCDGPPQMQSYLRPTILQNKLNSKNVEQTIKELAKRKILFCVRSTITKYNPLPKVVSYFGNLGVKFLHFERVAIVGRAKVSQLPSVKQYIKDFSRALEIAAKKKIYLITSSLMNLFYPADYFCTQLTGERYRILPNRKINLCYFYEKENIFAIGQISNNKFIFNKNRRERLNKITIPLKCEKCAFKYLCSGGCPAENLRATGTFQKIDKSQCIISKAILHRSINFLYNKSNKDRRKPFLPVIGNEVLERFLER